MATNARVLTNHTNARRSLVPGGSDLISRFAALRGQPGSEPGGSRPSSSLVYSDHDLTAAIYSSTGDYEPPLIGVHTQYPPPPNAVDRDAGDTSVNVAHATGTREASAHNKYSSLFGESEVWTRNLGWKSVHTEDKSQASPYITAIEGFPSENEFAAVGTPVVSPREHRISFSSQLDELPIHQRVVVDKPSLISVSASSEAKKETAEKESSVRTSPRDAPPAGGGGDDEEEDLTVAIRMSLGEKSRVPTRNNARRRPRLESVLDGPFDPTRFLQPEKVNLARNNRSSQQIPTAPENANTPTPVRRLTLKDAPPRQPPQLLPAPSLSPYPSPSPPAPAAAAAAQETVECSVCTDDFPPCSTAGGVIGAACDHSSPPELTHQHICRGCLEQHLAVQLEQSGANRLTCPLCLAELTYADIKEWASPWTFARYDTLRMRTTVSSDPNFIWCSNPACGAGQMHASGAEAPIVICQSCGTKTCFRHQQGWHEGLTCEEFDDPDAVEERERRDREEMRVIERLQRDEEWRRWRQLEGDEELARRIEAGNQQREGEEQDEEEEGGGGGGGGGEAPHRQQPQQQEGETERRRPRRRRQTQQQKQQRETDDRRLRERQQEVEWWRRMQQRQKEDERRARARREERAKRLAEEKRGENAVFKSTKPCPGPNCSYRVEKIDGCKHMTCTRCGYEWCWTCGKSWVYGHLESRCG